jgi:hypothetical protein
VHTPESPPHTVRSVISCLWLVLDLVLVFVGFGLFQICLHLLFSPHSKDHVLHRHVTTCKADATSPTLPDINDAEDSGARGKQDKRRGAGEGGEGPRAGGRRRYGRRPREFSTRMRGRGLHWSLLIPPLVLLVLAVLKTGQREAYHHPVLAHLTPPVLGGIVPVGSMTGAACGFNTAPFLFPFHTPPHWGVLYQQRRR